MNPTRRQFLGAGAATAVLGTAGCLDVIGLGDEAVDADGYAAFFPLWDFAEHIGGEAMSFTEPVGTGRMGHGWSPDANLVPEVASTEVFVYLDTPEFSWAQDVARTLERDHPDVATVDLFNINSDGADNHDEDNHNEDNHDEDTHDEDNHNEDTHDEDTHDEDTHDEDNHNEDNHNEDNHNEDNHDDGGHNHVDHDPHIWLDPMRAEEMVRTLGEELGNVYPDNESTFADNADAYAEEIGSIHDQLATVVEDATLDTAVLVGHNSFSYLSNRYGITLETPVGINPNASASQEDIGNLLDVIDQQGIDTVLYDPFESGASGEYPQLVETVFENSEVSEAEPLTPLSGTTDQWADNDWGWIEQMTEINIPSLEAALNPE